MGDRRVERDEPAHRVPEEDDGEAGILFYGKLADRADIVDNLSHAVAAGKTPDWRIRASRFAVPTVIEGEHMVAAGCHGCRKTGVTSGMLGQPMRHKDNSACL